MSKLPARLIVYYLAIAIGLVNIPLSAFAHLPAVPPVEMNENNSEAVAADDNIYLTHHHHAIHLQENSKESNPKTDSYHESNVTGLAQPDTLFCDQSMDSASYSCDDCSHCLVAIPMLSANLTARHDVVRFPAIVNTYTNPVPDSQKPPIIS